MTQGLFNILIKHAAELQPKPKHQEMLDSHFGSHEQSRWRDFRRAVRSKAFVNALKIDDRADDKMKRYAEGMLLHHSGKGESFTVSGHKRNYTVKYHKEQDRFTCSCPDWGYARSHQTNKDAQDCKHIKMVKLDLQSPGKKVKEAGFSLPRSAIGNLNVLAKKNRMDDQAARSNATVRAYRQQMPQPTGQGVGTFDLITGMVSPFIKRASIRGRAAQKLIKDLNDWA